MARFVDKEERGFILLNDLVVAFRFVEMKKWRKQVGRRRGFESYLIPQINDQLTFFSKNTQVLQRITSEFFHNRYRLMRAFRCFEFDELHGKIGQEGFKAGLRAINIILDKKALSEVQIESLHEVFYLFSSFLLLLFLFFYFVNCLISFCWLILFCRL